MASQNKGRTRKSGANARRRPGKIFRQRARLAKLVNQRKTALEKMPDGPAKTKKRNKLVSSEAKLAKALAVNIKVQASMLPKA